jgi:hypothetical protein
MIGDKKRGKMFQNEKATVRSETRMNSLSRFVVIKYSESASLPTSSLQLLQQPFSVCRTQRGFGCSGLQKTNGSMLIRAEQRNF